MAPAEAGPDVSVPSDAGVDADAGPPLASVPPRPSTEDETNKTLSLTFASAFAGFGPSADGGVTLAPDQISYDIDGVYTCPGAPSCDPPKGARATDTCDGLGGRDNAFSSFLDRLGFPQVRNGMTAQIEKGRTAVLMTVSDYNGGVNDRQVTVQVLLSLGIETVLDDGGFDPDAKERPPKGDGSDVWSVAESSLVGAPPDGTRCSDSNCIAVARDTAAYVSNGVLVSRVDVPLLLAELGPNAFLDVRGGVITAELVPNGQGFLLRNGQLVGRLKPEQALKTLGLVNNPLGTGGGLVCDDPASLGLLMQTVCQYRDVRVDPTKDRTPGTCDGVSVAYLFSGIPAHLGRVRAVVDDGKRCPDTAKFACP